MRNRLSSINRIDRVIYISTSILVTVLILNKKSIDTNLLVPILKPVSLIISTFLGISFDYLSDIGFYNETLSIVITRKCAGINFFITFFGMLTFSFISKFEGVIEKVIAMLAFFVCGYLVTILANASRIIGIVYMGKIDIFLDPRYKDLMHQSIGVVSYFTYFIMGYLFFDKSMKLDKTCK
ncbi:exosortase K [Wukongibacter baidiensis]|uniref:exosortase K n=1 Tax=Wukongibacter baidiensis TaxID=1723361 RepID=UPI003D7F8DDD